MSHRRTTVSRIARDAAPGREFGATPPRTDLADLGRRVLVEALRRAMDDLHGHRAMDANAATTAGPREAAPKRTVRR